jgi:hypothetical protein
MIVSPVTPLRRWPLSGEEIDPSAGTRSRGSVICPV